MGHLKKKASRTAIMVTRRNKVTPCQRERKDEIRMLRPRGKKGERGSVCYSAGVQKSIQAAPKKREEEGGENKGAERFR